MNDAVIEHAARTFAEQSEDWLFDHAHEPQEIARMAFEAGMRAGGLVNAQEAWEAAEEGSEWIFRSIGGHATVRTKGSFSPYWNETVSIERHVVEGLPVHKMERGADGSPLVGGVKTYVAPTTSTMLWAVRDTTSGAIYPQPNKLIAERVAEMHGHCEIIEVMVSSPTTQSQDHMHELVQHRDGKPPWCNVCLRTADGRLARDIPFGER